MAKKFEALMIPFHGLNSFNDHGPPVIDGFRSLLAAADPLGSCAAFQLPKGQDEAYNEVVGKVATCNTTFKAKIQALAKEIFAVPYHCEGNAEDVACPVSK